MKLYKVTVSGCDDSTSVIVNLSDEQADLVAELAAKITVASAYVCQPTMRINPDEGSEVKP